MKHGTSVPVFVWGSEFEVKFGGTCIYLALQGAKAKGLQIQNLPGQLRKTVSQNGTRALARWEARE